VFLKRALWHVYDVSFKVFLGVVCGLKWQNGLLDFPKIEKLYQLPKYGLFSYFVRRVGRARANIDFSKKESVGVP
jgi:hypothetical protein